MPRPIQKFLHKVFPSSRKAPKTTTSPGTAPGTFPETVLELLRAIRRALVKASVPRKASASETVTALDTVTVSGTVPDTEKVSDAAKVMVAAKVMDTATVVDKLSLSDADSGSNAESDSHIECISDTESDSDTESVPGKTMELLQLRDNSRFYKQVSQMFDSEWKHSGTTAKLKRIYVIKNRKDPKFQLGFHGTRRACTIGSDSTDPCDNPECCLCSILKDGFSLERARPSGMFGRRVYSSQVSSKADRYVKNYENNSDERVLILCGVEFLRTQELKMAGDPGANVDTVCVIGVTKANGGELFYHETAVRSVEQIKPLGLVVYSRCPP